METLTVDGYTAQCARCAEAIDLEAGSAALGEFMLAHSSAESLAHYSPWVCGADVGAYGLCVARKGHAWAHRDANGHRFTDDGTRVYGSRAGGAK